MGEIVGLMGPNGAGKSTTFNFVTGVLQATSGAIIFNGERIDKLASREIVKRGIGRTFQHVKMLPGMTVLENVAIGAHLRGSTGVWRNIVRRWRLRTTILCWVRTVGSAREKNYLDQLDHVFKLFPRLKERRKQAAGMLSSGERQILAVGRALMGKPQLLMLDERSLGLAPLIVKEIFHIISALRVTRVATLLIEQNARAALQISDYGYVLETGEFALGERWMISA